MSSKRGTPGDLIHGRRRDIGITRSEMARLIGASDDRYRDIERDDRQPTDREIAALARTLRIDPALLRRRCGRPAGLPAPDRRSAPIGSVPSGRGDELAARREATLALERRIEAAVAATEEIRRSVAEARLAARADLERVSAAESERDRLAERLAAERTRQRAAAGRRSELIRRLAGGDAAPKARTTPAHRAARSRP